MPPVKVYTSKPINTHVVAKPVDSTRMSCFPFTDPFQPESGFSRDRLRQSTSSSVSASSMDDHSTVVASTNSSMSEGPTTPKGTTITPDNKRVTYSPGAMSPKASYPRVRRQTPWPSISYDTPDDECDDPIKCGSPRSFPCARHSDPDAKFQLSNIELAILEAHRRLHLEQEAESASPDRKLSDGFSSSEDMTYSDWRACEFLDEEMDFLEEQREERLIQEEMWRSGKAY